MGLKGGSICLASNLTQSISLKNAWSRILCSPLAVQPSLSSQSFVKNCKLMKINQISAFNLCWMNWFATVLCMHIFYNLISNKKDFLQPETVRGYTESGTMIYETGGTKIHEAGLHEQEPVKQTKSGLWISTNRNNSFLSFFSVQMYDLSYIHL